MYPVQSLLQVSESIEIQFNFVSSRFDLKLSISIQAQNVHVSGRIQNISPANNFPLPLQSNIWSPPSKAFHQEVSCGGVINTVSTCPPIAFFPNDDKVLDWYLVHGSRAEGYFCQFFPRGH